MAYEIKFPLYSAKLTLANGHSYHYLLSDQDALHYQSNSKKVTEKYAEALQMNRLNKGIYGVMLREIHSDEFQRKKISVSFSAARDKMRFPEFSLEFDTFFKPHSKGYLAFIPAIGTQAFFTNLEDIDKRVAEAVKLEFTREKRLSHLQNVLETIWYEESNIERNEVSLKIPTLTEAEQLSQRNAEKLVTQIGRKVIVRQQVHFGGQNWLLQLGNALKSTFGKSTLIVGNSGVGKSSLIREAIHQQDKIGFSGEVWETTASVLIKELTRDTGWQDRLADLTKELSNSGDILYIRNLAELFEVGQYEGNTMSMAEYLRGFIGRGELVIITECTAEELARIELKAPGYASLFNIIRMAEPRGKELEKIIIDKVASISEGEKIKIEKSAVQEIIRLHLRFMPYSGFPGKPIRFLESILLGQESTGKKNIKQKQIIEAFAEESGMPLFMIDPKAPMNIEEIKQSFNQQVFGQELAVESLSNMLATVKTALTRVAKPIASFLFVGPTGVGKTELGKVLARFMFGDRDRLLRFDMSEYAASYDIQRLIGLGNSDGVLTSAVRRQPFSVVLFDEIEKAASNFNDLLLQVLSEGRLTDGRGKTVNFCSTMIIMTSNIGASNLQTQRIGWSNKTDVSDLSEHFVRAAEKHFRPELFNRIDQIVPFAPLNEQTVRFIIDREIKAIKTREGLEYRNVDLEITAAAKSYLTTKGYNEKYGARYLQRTLRQELIIPLAQKLNSYAWDDKLTVLCDVEEGQLSISLTDDPLGLDLLLEELEKVNNADLAAGLRRNLDALFDSFSWMQFTDELLLHQEQAQKENFSNYSPAAQRFVELNEEVITLKKIIEDIEEEIGLVCLNLKPYLPIINDKIENWQQDFHGIKTKLLSALQPNLSQCTFSIYGNEDYLPELIEEYRVIFQAFGIEEVEARLVWFRSTYFNEIIKKESAENTYKGARQEYVYSKLNASNTIHKPKEKDQLRGVEFSLRGDLVYTLLKDEAGIQSRERDKENILFSVQIEEGSSLQTPENVHRKEFFKGSIRRQLKNEYFKDIIYKVETEFKFLPQLLAEILLEKMTETLNELL